MENERNVTPDDLTTHEVCQEPPQSTSTASTLIGRYGKTKRDVVQAREEARLQVGGNAGDTGRPKPVFELEFVGELPPVKTKINLTEFSTVFNIDHNLGELADDIFQAENLVDAAIEEMVRPLVNRADTNDKISIRIQVDGMNEPFFSAYTSKVNFRTEDFLTSLAQSITSGREEFLSSGKMTLTVSVLKPLTGFGKRANTGESTSTDDVPRSRKQQKKGPKFPKTVENYYKAKKGMLKIRENTNRCFYLAIALAIIDKENPDNVKQNASRWKSYLNLQRYTLDKEAERIFREMGMDWDVEFSTDILVQLETKLPKYQIIIVDRDRPSLKCLPPVYSGQIVRHDKIVLQRFFSEACPWGHFNYIRSLTAYYDKRAFCTHCWSVSNVNQFTNIVLKNSFCRELFQWTPISVIRYAIGALRIQSVLGMLQKLFATAATRNSMVKFVMAII